MTLDNTDWRPRLSVDLTIEQAAALQRLLPHGFRKRVYSALTDMLIKAMEKEGLAVLNSVLAYELDLPALLAKRGN